MLVRELDGLPCIVRGRYEGPLRAVLVAFKHGGRESFRRMLGEALRAPLLRAIRIAAPSAPAGAPGEPGAPLVVAMPSRPRGVRERGYRHLDLLIASALRRQRAPALRVRALRTTRGRVGQVGLRAAQRERNARRIAVRRAARRVIHGRRVVLVDDIITTGASVRAARDALERAGASVAVIVALCTAERRDAAGLPAK
ncbi:ComF family protein [Leucobacter chromiiresistens]